ncbi:MAG: ABC transporter permease [Clostridiales bacterium]|nr:ABC transporter permease [Clostridiales bacterium]
MSGILIGILEQGFIYGIMAMGIYISYKILDFPDLTVDGTFPLGAAVSTALVTVGVNPWLCLLAAAAAGVAAGCITGILHVKFKIKDLLSGILVMTGLYSVNYRIVGSPNEFLMAKPTIFDAVKEGSPLFNYRYLIILLVITVAVKILLDLYLNTKSGFLLKSVGDNEGLVVTLAQDPGKIKIIGLAIANGLVGLSGALFCQRTMQFDISSGTGTMVMGLAAVIIGTTVFKRVKFMHVTTGVILGMVIYKACITIALSSGLQSSDTKMVVTVLFLATMILNDAMKRTNGGRKNA